MSSAEIKPCLRRSYLGHHEWRLTAQGSDTVYCVYCCQQVLRKDAEQHVRERIDGPQGHAGDPLFEISARLGLILEILERRSTGAASR